MRTAAYTHFISLPITSARVQGKVVEFQNIARGRSGLEGMTESSFVKPSRMHITVGMLRLATEGDRRAAAGCLESLGRGVREILGGGALDVRVCGVETMERDAREARILYAKVEDAGTGGDRLRRVCEYVRDAFGRAGLIDDGMQRELKLHMTVVRASGANPVANEGKGRRARNRQRFTVDARGLIEEFGQAPFGTCRIGQIQIARRFHFTEDGAYANDGILELP
ncbi:activating signal cointegrator 1 complex subunit [Coemansia sp. RSA 2049]|nr:activating signal cointegrator 1 complex subunit [Coemansia sp. RSA 2049]KAJ2517390.1 activating signal cointegrator 1 complex subunit [Coemansia sp. RSA 1939]KAJ2612532.1 activating signal cointegrator 1 complex subunit [Coemansia sp. RSA 1804]KAJ2690751.1 activating signal cointegrator 1 complex subunit [Coemansia sp. RSA 1285]